MAEEIDDNKLIQAYQYWHDCGFDEGFEEGYDLGWEDGYADGLAQSENNQEKSDCPSRNSGSFLGK